MLEQALVEGRVPEITMGECVQGKLNKTFCHIGIHIYPKPVFFVPIGRSTISKASKQKEAKKVPNLNHSIIVVHGGRYYKQVELGLGLPNNKASIRFLLSRTIIPSRIGWRVSHRVMDGFTLHAISLRAGTNEVRSKKKRDLPHRLAMLEINCSSFLDTDYYYEKLFISRLMVSSHQGRGIQALKSMYIIAK